MEDLLGSALGRSVRYLQGAPERRVSPPQAAVDRLAELGGALPEGPSDPEQVLAMLDDIGSPATVINAGGRYFGFVNGGSLPAALASFLPSFASSLGSIRSDRLSARISPLSSSPAP